MSEILKYLEVYQYKIIRNDLAILDDNIHRIFLRPEEGDFKIDSACWGEFKEFKETYIEFRGLIKHKELLRLI